MQFDAAAQLGRWLRRFGQRLRDGVEEGLTLIEMLAVVVIIAIVAAIAIPAVSSAIRTSKVDATEATLGTLQTALARYNLDVGQYPSSLNLLVSGTLTLGQPGWDGPYLDEAVPVDDGWNNPIYYDPITSSDSNTVTGYILASGDGVPLTTSGAQLLVSGSTSLSSSSTLILAGGGAYISGTTVDPLGMRPTQENLSNLSSSSIFYDQLVAGTSSSFPALQLQWSDN